MGASEPSIVDLPEQTQRPWIAVHDRDGNTHNPTIVASMEIGRVESFIKPFQRDRPCQAAASWSAASTHTRRQALFTTSRLF